MTHSTLNKIDMLIIPAIDIREKKVVRLWQGDFDKATVYADNPLEMAVFWQEEGARFLHLVDLDGALDGRPQNLDTIKDISSSLNIPVQAGGGLREEKDIADLLASGVRRVVLGTRACEDRDWVKNLVNRFPEKIVISLDIKDGFLVSRGWQTKTSIRPEDFTRDMKEAGVELFIITDVSRDGTMFGSDTGYISDFLSSVPVKLIIAGGIGSLADIEKLKTLEAKGLSGVIVGRALYEKKFTLKEAMKIANQK